MTATRDTMIAKVIIAEFLCYALSKKKKAIKQRITHSLLNHTLESLTVMK
jgi:hypothetical protein